MFGYVYSITVAPTGEVYIGQTSKWPEVRWREHVSALERGQHHNRKLQAAAKKHGVAALVFREVVQVPLDQLDEAEHKAIHAIADERSLNLNRNRANYAASRKRKAATPPYSDTLWFVDNIGPLTPDQLKAQFGWSLQEARKLLYRRASGRIRMIRRDTLHG